MGMRESSVCILRELGAAELAKEAGTSEEDIEKEIQMAGARVQVMALIPEHITGKRIHEA